MIDNDEFSKDLLATQRRNLKPVTVTLTAIEVFAIVSAVQISENAIPELSSLGACAKEAAKKMQDCLDPDSLLFLHLNKGWDLEESYISSGGNLSAEDFPPEGFTDYD
jgi:hypothetical protein